MKLRVATDADVEPMLALKSQLQLQLASPDSRHGGFLLGSSAEQYQFFVNHAQVLVLDAGLAPDQSTSSLPLIGFVIGLGDCVLRQSDLWARRHAIQWYPSQASHQPPLENFHLSYIEQLAVLPGITYRSYAPALALAIAQRLLADHDYILTTTVHQPIRNLAALPLLAISDAQLMGFIDEDYPQVGRITSALHAVERSRFAWQLRHGCQRRLLTRIQKTVDQLQQIHSH